MTKVGYVYKLAIKDGSIDDCYVGSTCRIRQRKYDHKINCNNENRHSYNYRVYRFIRENGGFENWDLYLLDEIKYNDKIEILKREREWIERLKPKLNVHKNPYRTEDERKMIIKKCNQIQKEQNPKLFAEKASERMRRWRAKNKNNKIHCECGSIFHISEKNTHLKSLKHKNFVSQI